jgi:hypothetical protein
VTHQYYSRLSQRAYDRLLTLLAVREAMRRNNVIKRFLNLVKRE